MQGQVQSRCEVSRCEVSFYERPAATEDDEADNKNRLTGPQVAPRGSLSESDPREMAWYTWFILNAISRALITASLSIRRSLYKYETEKNRPFLSFFFFWFSFHYCFLSVPSPKRLSTFSHLCSFIRVLVPVVIRPFLRAIRTFAKEHAFHAVIRLKPVRDVIFSRLL